MDRLARWAGFGTLLLAALGCAVELPISGGAAIRCESDRHCPGPLRCATSVGECFANLENDAPTLDSAIARSRTTVRLVFSEAVRRESATVAANFTAIPALDFDTAVLAEDDNFQAGSAVLTLTSLSAQAEGQPYVVRADGITDLQGNRIDLTANTATFDGFGTPPDRRPPQNIYPRGNSSSSVDNPGAPLGDVILRDANVTFVWTPRVGAQSYTLSIDDDPMFTPPVRHEVTIGGNDNSHPVNLTSLGLTDGIYYWRVLSSITDPQDPAIAVDMFGIFTGNALHVYCPAGQPCACANPMSCTLDPQRLGTVDRPLRSVGKAQELAVAIGVDLIKIAGRGAGEYYAESIGAPGFPLNYEGGYDPVFTAQNPSLNETIFRAPEITYFGFAQTRPTYIDGFTLEAELDPMSQEDSARAVLIFGSDDVTVRNCRLEVRGSPPSGEGLGVVNGSGHVLENLTIVVPDTLVDAEGIGVLGAQVTVRSVDIQVGSAVTGDAKGLSMEGNADVLVDGATITVGDAGQDSIGVDVNDSNADLHNVVVDAGMGLSGEAAAIHADNNSSLQLTDADLSRPLSDFQAALTVEFGSSATVTRARVVGSWALRVTNAPALLIRSSVFVAPDGLTAHLKEISNAVIVDSVFAAVSGDRVLIFDEGVNAVVTNSIFTCQSPLFATSVPVVEGHDQADPASFQNNFLGGCPEAYQDENMVALSGLGSLDGEPVENSGCGMACPQSNVSGNIVDPTLGAAGTFVDIDGADNDITTWGDNDWHLTPTALDVMVNLDALGKDSTGADCGDRTTAVPCGGDGVDLDGRVRTLPFTIGAHEHD